LNPNDNRYNRFALVREMMDAVNVARRFDPERTRAVSEGIRSKGKLLLAGEGSSRIFPAKNAVHKSLRWGMDLRIVTAGSRQAALYGLSDFAVFCASNSGRTKEIVTLARKLAGAGHADRYALTAGENTALEEVCDQAFILDCGKEQAVAATKSVVEQALFYESILWNLSGRHMAAALRPVPGQMEQALTMDIPGDAVKAAAGAPTIYFAGFNDGVAEELALKTNEITRKKSDYLEGTFAVHGIEEVMDPNDTVFVIDPIHEEIDKFREVLVDGVGCKVVAIADRETPFPTIRVPNAGEFNSYVYLCAGWNLLVEVGLTLGIDLDKPARARKVGNEIVG